ncbi:MAG TPA: ATP-binding protein [Oculatellaceae cyanobacterium]
MIKEVDVAKAKDEPMQVLVVEDNPTQSTLLRLHLQKLSFNVECVGTLTGALERLAKPGIDVVLLDLSLPDSQGIDTFYRVHSLAENTPVVVLSALDDQELALEALHSGAQDYLIKGRVGDDSIVRCLRYAIERNRVESALRMSERHTRLIIENSLDAFIAIDVDGIITDWNLQAEKQFGWSRKQVIGKSVAEVIVPSRFRDKHVLDKNQLFSVAKGRFMNRRREMYVLRRNGEEFPVEIGVFPIKDPDGIMYCAFVSDITERKHIEAKTQELNEELERRVQERTQELIKSNEELEQFAKVASHDLQEPLRAIQGFVSLLEKRYKGKLDPDADEFIGFIVDGTTRMQQLIQSVLLHSSIKKEEGLENITDVNAVVDEVLTNLRAAITESKAEFEIEDLPEVAVDRTQLIQLFQNLISNSIKYRNGPPKIAISAELSVDRWLFTLRDNGIGVDPKYAERIFDMFARLHGKTEYSGTGIGLAICKKIVLAHGGRIWMESEPGHGSIFYFSLPAATQDKEKVNGQSN